MVVRFLEFGTREVINCNTGKNLGHVIDVEIDIRDFCLKSLYIPYRDGSFCFGKKKEYRIPVSCIVKIGLDVILVDVDEKKCIYSCEQNK